MRSKHRRDLATMGSKCRRFGNGGVEISSRYGNDGVKISSRSGNGSKHLRDLATGRNIVEIWSRSGNYRVEMSSRSGNDGVEMSSRSDNDDIETLHWSGNDGVTKVVQIWPRWNRKDLVTSDC